MRSLGEGEAGPARPIAPPAWPLPGHYRRPLAGGLLVEGREQLEGFGQRRRGGWAAAAAALADPLHGSAEGAQLLRQGPGGNRVALEDRDHLPLPGHGLMQTIGILAQPDEPRGKLLLVAPGLLSDPRPRRSLSRTVAGPDLDHDPEVAPVLRGPEAGIGLDQGDQAVAHGGAVKLERLGVLGSGWFVQGNAVGHREQLAPALAQGRVAADPVLSPPRPVRRHRL